MFQVRFLCCTAGVYVDISLSQLNMLFFPGTLSLYLRKSRCCKIKMPSLFVFSLIYPFKKNTRRERFKGETDGLRKTFAGRFLSAFAAASLLYYYCYF